MRGGELREFYSRTSPSGERALRVFRRKFNRYVGVQGVKCRARFFLAMRRAMFLSCKKKTNIEKNTLKMALRPRNFNGNGVYSGKLSILPIWVYSAYFPKRLFRFGHFSKDRYGRKDPKIFYNFVQEIRLILKAQKTHSPHF